MKYIITIALALLSLTSNAQSEFYKKVLKRSTFYTSINGGNSLSDDDTYSVSTGPLTTGVIQTPFDYSIKIGVRKIARFGYENRANAFYDGTSRNAAIYPRQVQPPSSISVGARTRPELQLPITPDGHGILGNDD